MSTQGFDKKGFGKIVQVAYLTENLDASIKHWMETAGVGPWTLYKNVAMTGQYNGKDTAVKFNVGLSYSDDLQIEIIEMISKTPSPYQDANGRTLVGMHHMAWFSNDLAADVKAAEKRGLTCVYQASNGVSSVAYCNSKTEPGILFEFITASPVITDGFASGVAASKAWDGVSNPVTVIDFDA